MGDTVLNEICIELNNLNENRSLTAAMCTAGNGTTLIQAVVEGLGSFSEEMVDYISNETLKFEAANCLAPCALEECRVRDQPKSVKDIIYTISIQVLVFALVFGLAGSVDFGHFKERIKSKGILVGLFSQFFLMPAIGFATIAMFNSQLETLFAVSLLVVTSSPGGSYSNWWCNLINADLALSVAMTTVSTIMSVGMLPLNIIVYIELGYKKLNPEATDSITALLPYTTIGYTLAVVISAVCLGLYCGYHFPERMKFANKLGTACGFLSILLGAFASSTSCAKPWEQEFILYIAVLVPVVLGLGLAMLFASCVGVPKPQRVAIAIETAYQNTGIALAVALSLGPLGRASAVVPVIYGGYEAVIFLVYCLLMWYIGWTLSPDDVGLFKAMFTDYQYLIKDHPHYKGYHGDDQAMLSPAVEDDKSKSESL